MRTVSLVLALVLTSATASAQSVVWHRELRAREELSALQMLRFDDAPGMPLLSIGLLQYGGSRHGDPNSQFVLPPASMQVGDRVYTNLTEGGGAQDQFVVQVGPDGSFHDVLRVEGHGNSVLVTVTPLARGGYAIAGIGPPGARVATAQLASPGDPQWAHWFVARLDASGARVWTFEPRASADNDEAYFTQVLEDAAGDLYFIGSFHRELRLPDGRRFTSGYFSGFIGKLDGATGALEWIQTMPTGSFTRIAILSSGELIASGGFVRRARIGRVTLGGGRPGESGNFLARFDSRGRVTSFIEPGGAATRGRGLDSMRIDGDTAYFTWSRPRTSPAEPGVTRNERGVLAYSLSADALLWDRILGADPSAPVAPGLPGPTGFGISDLALTPTELYVAVSADGRFAHAGQVIDGARTPVLLRFDRRGNPLGMAMIDGGRPSWDVRLTMTPAGAVVTGNRVPESGRLPHEGFVEHIRF
ncbi:MAG: hypothetical protein AB7S26_18645 [Sandaracinaceae bacterium]